MVHRILIVILFSTLLLSSCDSLLVNKSLNCTEIIIVKIHQFNAKTHRGVVLFEGEHMEHGLLRVRSHLPGLPSVATTLKNGRYFHALPTDSKVIKDYVGDNVVPVCWFEDNRFQNARFYISIVNE